MAIVINGSGTVTGISVGGLPDGIVDAGTLATDSVDSAELIDGSIDTAHIAADQITGAILPAGSVLQVVRMTTTTATNSTSSSFVDITDLDIQITPSATSSKVLVMASVKGINPSENGLTAVSIQLLDSNGSTVMDFDENHGYQVGDDGALNSVSLLTGLSSPSSTSELTYKVQGRNRQVVAWSINGSTNTQSSIVAMEIAG